METVNFIGCERCNGRETTSKRIATPRCCYRSMVCSIQHPFIGWQTSVRRALMYHHYIHAGICSKRMHRSPPGICLCKVIDANILSAASEWSQTGAMCAAGERAILIVPINSAKSSCSSRMPECRQQMQKRQAPKFRYHESWNMMHHHVCRNAEPKWMNWNVEIALTNELNMNNWRDCCSNNTQFICICITKHDNFFVCFDAQKYIAFLSLEMFIALHGVIEWHCTSSSAKSRASYARVASPADEEHRRMFVTLFSSVCTRNIPAQRARIPIWMQKHK